ncbi:hypothetical protein, partial [Burkholderia glumae]|uniref:hypothetical protein n=1 Tax=Burkholderia glumae TaxID=337 RepID=UPI001E4DAB41
IGSQSRRRDSDLGKSCAVWGSIHETIFRFIVRARSARAEPPSSGATDVFHFFISRYRMTDDKVIIQLSG